jgi:glycosyltransferase involved in cell wall biosynthesis
MTSLNKSYNIVDFQNSDFLSITKSFEKLKNSFINQNVPYHLDGENEFFNGHLPRLWEYSSAILLSGIQKNETVLDAGAAYSLLSPWLSLHEYNVWANDITPYHQQRKKQIQFTKKKFPLDIYNLAKTNYPDGFFDKVFCISVLEHINPTLIPDVLTELFRVLKPGGTLTMTFDFYKEHIPYGTGNFHGAKYCQYFSIDSIQAFFANTEFKFIESGFEDDTNWESPPIFGEYNFGRVFLTKPKVIFPINKSCVKLEKKPYKIAHTSFDFYYGGIQEQVQNIVEYSTRQEIEHIVIAKDGGPLEQWMIDNKKPYVLIPDSQIADFCDMYDIDLVIAHTINGTPVEEHLYAYQLYNLGIPTIDLHYCAYQGIYPDWLFTKIVTNAHSTLKYIPSNKVLIIPLSVNHSRLETFLSREEIKKIWNIPKESIVIGRLSRLEPTKLIEQTIIAMSEIKSRYDKPLFFIIGGAEALFKNKGVYFSSLQNLAKEKGVEILFTGPIYGHKKAELLNLIDINLAPTSFEGYGLIFIEPAFCQVPTVTFDHSANKEVVGAGGVVVPYGDMDALVDATLTLINDAGLRERLGQTAMDQVMSRNLPQMWCDSIEKVIVETLELPEHRSVTALPLIDGYSLRKLRTGSFLFRKSFKKKVLNKFRAGKHLIYRDLSKIKRMCNI